MSDAEFGLENEDEEMSAAEAALADAQRRVAELRERNRPKVLEDVRRKIQAYHFTAEELGFAPARQSPAAKAPAVPPAPDAPKVGDGRSFVRPKYIGPEGQAWSGRGKDPLWLREQIKNGRTKEEFRAPGDKSN